MLFKRIQKFLRPYEIAFRKAFPHFPKWIFDVRHSLR